MKIFSRAPTRVDLAGGTLDIWPLFLFHEDSQTINFAVDLYTTCVLEPRRDKKIHLVSRDLKCEESFSNLAALERARRYRLPLTALLVRFFRPRRGFTLTTDSQAPAGAGIAGSSALNIAICGALNRFTRRNLPLEKLQIVARNVEAQVIRVPTGEQDYFPAIYGGVSAVRLTAAGVVREGIHTDLAAFERRIALCYTGAPRQSGINNWEVMKAHIDGVPRVVRNFDQIAAIACGMRRALEKKDWGEVARLLREEWAHRRRNAPGISTPLIDHLIRVAGRHGAEAAKVCGAGGGGCVLFFTADGARKRVENALAREGGQVQVLDVRVATRGLKVSRIR